MHTHIFFFRKMCFNFFLLNYRQIQRFHSFYTFCVKICICFCDSMNGLWFENFRANLWNIHSWKTIQKNEPVSNDVVYWKLTFVLHLFLGNVGIITQKTISAYCIRWLSKAFVHPEANSDCFCHFRKWEAKRKFTGGSQNLVKKIAFFTAFEKSSFLLDTKSQSEHILHIVYGIFYNYEHIDSYDIYY